MLIVVLTSGGFNELFFMKVKRMIGEAFERIEGVLVGAQQTVFEDLNDKAVSIPTARIKQIYKYEESKSPNSISGEGQANNDSPDLPICNKS